MNNRIQRLAAAFAVLIAASAASAQTPTGIAPGVITLPPVPGAPLPRTTRISPAEAAPAPDSLRLHSTNARTQWQQDETFGTRMVWWLGGGATDPHVTLALRVAANVRYRMTCDYAPTDYPAIYVRDLPGLSNQVPGRAAPSGDRPNDGDEWNFPSLIPDLPGIPPAETAEVDARFRYAEVRLTWRRTNAQSHRLTATLDAVPREAWRELRFETPPRGGIVVLYGCEISPIGAR